MRSRQGDFLEGFFHHPAEVVAEPSVDGEYVEGSLVVGDEDVGCVFANVLVSGDGYGDEVEPAE